MCISTHSYVVCGEERVSALCGHVLGAVRILSHTSSMVEAVTLGKARENSLKMSK